MERAVVVPIAAPPTKLHGNDAAHPPYQCNCNTSTKNRQSMNLLLGNQCSTLDKNSDEIAARMPPPKSSIPPAAQSQYRDYFDPWNSSSSGHQRAENRLGASTGWRVSRNTKLSYQFKSGNTGGIRVSDTVGAGSEDYDEKAKALIPRHVRERAKSSVLDMLVLKGNSGMRGTNTETTRVGDEEKLMAKRKQEDETKEEEKNGKKGIFNGLVIYINGSTHPLVSDHKLKHLLAENGAHLSLHLGRRSVTHVILGKPSSAGAGAGGGLAGTKIQKEIQRVRGCGVKYVGVEWYVYLFSFEEHKLISGTGSWKVSRTARDFRRLNSPI